MARRPARRSSLALAGLAACLSAASPLASQDRDVAILAAVVDYVGSEGIYLPVGADDGLVEGDTMAISMDASDEAVGSVVLISVTRRRSVAFVLESAAELGRGTTVLLHRRLPEESTASPPTDRPRAPPTDPSHVSTRVAPAAPAPLNPSSAPPDEAGLRVSGRVAFDLLARETRTRWAGNLFGDTRRRFAIPTTRLSLDVRGLPGGLELRTSLRGSYRWREVEAGPPPLSVRAYQAALGKRFERLPLELTLGRFSNPYEGYSSYWDGVLLRVGHRRGRGIGVVAGYEPRRYDEGFHTGLAKATAFGDFAARGSSWRYDTDVSVHLLRPEGSAKVTFLGWSQRLVVGRASIHQRLRVDGLLDDRAPFLAQLKLRAKLPVAGPLGLRAAYGRSRPAVWAAPELVAGQVPPLLSAREEISMGVEVDGRRGSVAIDAGRTTRSDGDEGRSLSGRAFTLLGSTRLLVSARLWRHGGSESYAAAPSMSFQAGPLRWRAGYRFYRTRAGYGVIDTHAVEAHASGVLVEGMRLTVGAEQQWGSNLSGTTVRLGIWRSF